MVSPVPEKDVSVVPPPVGAKPPKDGQTNEPKSDNTEGDGMEVDKDVEEEKVAGVEPEQKEAPFDLVDGDDDEQTKDDNQEEAEDDVDNDKEKCGLILR